MNREILFRGKVIESYLHRSDGKWVFGSLLLNGDEARIFEQDGNSWLVDPKTVGQFTGLTLKGGKKVFEHDIVENNGCHGYPNWKPKQVVWGNTLDKALSACCGFMLDGTQMFLATNDKNMTLHGNIHDNPELLKQGTEKKYEEQV